MQACRQVLNAGVIALPGRHRVLLPLTAWHTPSASMDASRVLAPGTGVLPGRSRPATGHRPGRAGRVSHGGPGRTGRTALRPVSALEVATDVSPVGIYAILGASAASFAGTFFVAPFW